MDANDEALLDAVRRGASPEAWRALLTLLQNAPAEPPDRPSLDAVEALLEGWPDGLRATMCGAPWDDTLFAGGDRFGLRLVRKLRYDSTFVGRYGGMMMRSPNLTLAHLGGLAASPATAFLTELDFASQDVGAEGARVLAGNPRLTALRRLRLSGAKLDDAAARALAAAPWLEGLRELDLSSNRITAAGLRSFAGHGRSLEGLSLYGNPLGPSGARALARSSFFGGLRSLSLGRTGLGDDGLLALASKALAPLASLAVSDDGLTDEGVARWAASRKTPPLLQLDVSSNDLTDAALEGVASLFTSLRGLTARDNLLGDDGVAALAARRCRVTRLNLGDNDVTARGLRELLQSEAGRFLESLQLDGARIDGEAMAPDRLASSPAALRGLELRQNRLRASGVRALAAWLRDAAVRDLGLADNALGPDAAEALASSALGARLRTLDLSDNSVGDDGVAALARGVDVRWLDALSLRRAGVTDRGLVRLAALPWAPHALSLGGNAIGDEGARALAASPACARLRHLDLSENRLTDEGVAALAASPYLRALERLSLTANPALTGRSLDALLRWEAPPLSVDLDWELTRGREAEVKRVYPPRCCP